MYFCISLLPESLPRQNLKFDLWGFIFSATGCFTLLLALSEGTKEGWSSYYIVVLLTFSFYALLLFVIVELNHDQPMLILMPAAIVTALMMPISGVLFDRFGPKVLAFAGLTPIPMPLWAP